MIQATPPGAAPLPVALVVDDEQPARDELAWLLGRDPRVGEVRVCASATEALRVLHEGGVDVVFLDIAMPGLSGLELAGVLAAFREPPPVVFVTAHEEHALEAFDLSAVDYLLKPLREERLAEAVRRVLARSAPPPAPADDEQVRVERGGVTRFLPRSTIRYVEAQGDYARLHARVDGEAASYLVRTPLTTLEEEWAGAGFVRVHRSLLVALAHVAEVRMDAGRCTVLVDGTELGVSRRHTRALREVLAGRVGAR
ncbi:MULTISPECIES: LytTR family DNA-binding domain-containing protein [unclassified Nocardioides]|uniref:LytR/AlgR family response regulator transcription factor n=1 Tax=unclassified Nocardioides TaxID=2615069 RepID=UPI002406FB03|nr:MULTISPECIES: LytTR family DNA-binding domain-containing protein [unclassified Nocardioides]